jgi:hypothetical protein
MYNAPWLLGGSFDERPRPREIGKTEKSHFSGCCWCQGRNHIGATNRLIIQARTEMRITSVPATVPSPRRENMRLNAKHCFCSCKADIAAGFTHVLNPLARPIRSSWCTNHYSQSYSPAVWPLLKYLGRHMLNLSSSSVTNSSFLPALFKNGSFNTMLPAPRVLHRTRERLLRNRDRREIPGRRDVGADQRHARWRA